jgi:hypothetical protein
MLKVKFVILAMLGLLFTEMAGLKAQSLVIQMKDGTQVEEQISSIQKLSFSVSDLLVSLKNGTIDPYGLSTIQKLRFDQSTAVVEQVYKNISKLLIYPNPASESLTISGMPDGIGVISVYKPDGQLMISETVSDDQATIIISGLNPGLYFVSAKGLTSKFVKL